MEGCWNGAAVLIEGRPNLPYFQRPLCRGRDCRPVELVIGKAVLMVMAGLALGAAASLALTRVLESLLYATSPTNRMMWSAAAALLLAVALLACYLPA